MLYPTQQALSSRIHKINPFLISGRIEYYAKIVFSSRSNHPNRERWKWKWRFRLDNYWCFWTGWGGRNWRSSDICLKCCDISDISNIKITMFILFMICMRVIESYMYKTKYGASERDYFLWGCLIIATLSPEERPVG